MVDSATCSRCSVGYVTVGLRFVVTIGTRVVGIDNGATVGTGVGVQVVGIDNGATVGTGVAITLCVGLAVGGLVM